MKILLKIALTLSIGFNIYFFYTDYKNRLFRDAINKTMEGSYDNINDASHYLLKRITNEQSHLLAKKYYFISIWNMACGPCIKEMPTLDSLADLITRKDIGYIHLTENGSKTVAEFLKRKRMAPRNFVYMNDGNDYIMALLKSQGVSNKSYPLQVIIDRNGNLLHFGGAYIQVANDSALTSTLNALP